MGKILKIKFTSLWALYFSASLGRSNIKYDFCLEKSLPTPSTFNLTSLSWSTELKVQRSSQPSPMNLSNNWWLRASFQFYAEMSKRLEWFGTDPNRKQIVVYRMTLKCIVQARTLLRGWEGEKGAEEVWSDFMKWIFLQAKVGRD